MKRDSRTRAEKAAAIAEINRADAQAAAALRAQRAADGMATRDTGSPTAQNDWTPNRLPGLLLWIDAGNGACIFPPADGAQVPAINDLSRSNHGTAIPGVRPIFKRNAAVLKGRHSFFGGSQQFFNHPVILGGGGAMKASYEAIIIRPTNAFGANGTTVAILGGYQVRIYSNDAPPSPWGIVAGAGFTSSTMNLALNTTYLLEIECDAGAATLRFSTNGTTVSVAIPAAFNTGLTQFGGIGTAWGSGQVWFPERIICSGQISAPNQALVRAYAYAKYGIVP